MGRLCSLRSGHVADRANGTHPASLHPLPALAGGGELAIQNRSLSLAVEVALAILLVLGPAPRPVAAAQENYFFGTAFDAITLAPLANVCVVLGPALVRCTTMTAADGTYRLDFPPGDPIPVSWSLHFLARDRGYADFDSASYVAAGPVKIDAPMTKPRPVGTQACDTTGTPTMSVYLPNVTKTLGGPTGWQTPYIVQNTGAVPTTLEVSLYKFADGSLWTCRKVVNLQPGSSYADVPNNDLDLPDDSQFSVVIRSFGASVVSVVNEHQGSGDRAEAMAYDGYSQGAASVSLPNITRRFFGYVTPFIIQNVGQNPTVAQARFVSFDGTAPEVVVQRTILAGRSQFVNPNAEPGLVDGHQYAVTVTAGEPVGVVVNTHNDAPGTANPVAYSDDGLAVGGATIYGAYAAKNAQGIGRVATIVVQNMGASGSTAVSPTIAFRPLGGGTAKSFDLPSIPPGASRAFDPRYSNGDVTQPLCGSAGTSTCLADGEYSFIVAVAPPTTASAASSASLAAVVNVISPATAMGYAATSIPARRVYLPNVTRTLGGPTGWTTPIVVQSASATTGQLTFYRFSDQKLVLTQPLSLSPGDSVRIDPRDLSTLSDDTQYSVVVDGADGTLSAIVIELASGGDSAMIYEGFPAGP